MCVCVCLCVSVCLSVCLSLSLSLSLSSLVLSLSLVNHFVFERVKQCSKDVKPTEQQSPKSPTVTFTWHACKLFEDVALVEFMYLVFTRMPGECYRRRLRSFLLLCLCDVFRALIISLAC